MDLELDSTGDLVLDEDLVLVDGLAAIAQELTIRMKFFRGEWFIDTRVGMPYYQQILGQKPRLNILRAIYNSAILSTPGVLTVQNLLVEYTGSTRHVPVSFRATTTEGPLEYNKEFII